MLYEHELILLCSRPRRNTEHLERIKYLLARKIDWKFLFEEARFHKVFPLLYPIISKYFHDTVSADIALEYKKQYLRICSSNLLRARQLSDIVTLLDRGDITTVPFKGPVLSEYLFGDINDRTYSDLDILVEKEDFGETVSLLQANGYRFDIELDFDQYMQLALKGFHAKMIENKSSSMVEVHWEMTGRYFLKTMEMVDIQRRLKKIPFLDREVSSLSAEDLLLYLCIHGNKNRWIQLDHINCVARLLDKVRALDWHYTVKAAERYGARRMLLLGCYLAAKVFEIELRENILKIIDDEPLVQEIGDRVQDTLFATQDEKNIHKSYWNEVKYNWQTMDNTTDWFFCSMMPIFQPTHSDWEWLRLPAAMSWVHYLTRPIRLGLKYIKKMF